MAEVFFEKLAEIKGGVIFLDIDGTLVVDGGSEVTGEVLRRLECLKEEGRVLLCTNSPEDVRNREIEGKLGLKIVNKVHRKPSRKILDEVGDLEGKELLVIGDKYLTDGLFANNIGAKFVKVKRKISGGESLKIRAYNCIDNLVGKCIMRAWKKWCIW